MKKQYIGISRDHSGSMSHLSRPAMKDYNDNIEAIKSAARDNNIDTIVSTVRCGIGGGVDREVVNSSINRLEPLRYYDIDGSTPLYDSVGELIDILSSTPDANQPEVSFLVLVITDGEENSSKKWGAHSLAQKIKTLQATDRWTFAFRVPRGYASALQSRLRIPAGNIQEWEQTEKGMLESSHQTRLSTQSYFFGRAHGMSATQDFYTNAADITKNEAKLSLVDISKQVEFFKVKRGGEQIKPFVERKLGRGLMLGQAFYQLSKPEKAVQSYKLIAIRDKSNGKVYAGREARDLLNLPHVGTIKLSPGDHGNWDVFVQSTSTNRLLVAGTEVMHWDAARRY